MSGLAEKWKAERYKFYDDLLTKILGFPKVQEDIADSKSDTEWNKEHQWGDMEIEESALENFFQGDDEDLYNMPEIWQQIKEALRDEITWITSDPKTFIQDDGICFKAEKIVNQKLEEIHDELYEALKRKHGKVKQELTISPREEEHPPNCTCEECRAGHMEDTSQAERARKGLGVTQ